jgi:hypothetical protein
MEAGVRKLQPSPERANRRMRLLDLGAGDILPFFYCAKPSFAEPIGSIGGHGIVGTLFKKLR